MKLVSIVITNYNYGRFLGRAIRSCLNQSLGSDKIEILVIDDCSSDNSRVIIQNFEKDVKAIFNSERRGVAYCSNLGIKHSQGMYVMRVDADDYINEKMVDILLLFLDQNPTKAFAYCDHIRVNEMEAREERVYLDNEEALLNHGAGVLFKKSALEAVGLYDEDMRNCEDMVLIKRLAKQGFQGIYVQLPLYRYLRHGVNMTEDKQSRETWRQIAREKIENENW